MPFQIIRNDITRMKTAAIVNAANEGLQAGGGVCGAIFSAAGAQDLTKACDKIGRCPTGQAVITPGFALPAQYVIHAVGPIWRDGHHNEEKLLYSCYQASLHLALEHQLESIAFPLISSGIYGYPKEQALQVATRAIRDFLELHEMDVYLVVFDKSAFALSSKLVSSVQSYIDDHYASYYNAAERTRRMQMLQDMPCQEYSVSSYWDDLDLQLDESFSQALLRMIHERGLKDSDVYKKANVDRKHFSKIRGDIHYKPKKTTALAFAIALELNLSQTNALLEKAGFVLTQSSKLDIIVEYFILHKNYNIMAINEVLFAFDQSLLGV